MLSIRNIACSKSSSRLLLPIIRSSGKSTKTPPSSEKCVEETFQVLEVSDAGRSFFASVDVSGFAHQNIQVSLCGYKLTAYACEENFRGRSVTRCQTHEWSLPYDADVTHIRPKLSSLGVLTIEIPKTQYPSSRIIPIQLEDE